MDVSLGFHIVRVTEQAALKSALWRGKGDEHSVDDAATTAMREVLNTLPISATVVIGEGEMDKAPMLYIGEKLGTGGEALDIAVDPLEGTTLTAKNRENAITVIALAKAGSLLHAPDMYMMKLGVGPKAKGVIDLSLSLTENLKRVAQALGKKPEEVNVVMLDRDRHKSYVEECRSFGARVTLITDGDVCPIVGAGLENVDIDVLFGIGGAPEGVLAATAARCMGGDFQGKLWPESEQELERCRKMGIDDPKNHIFRLEELVKTDEVIFCLTGVTGGYLTRGVEFTPKGALTHTLLLNAQEKTVRFIETCHSL